MKFENKNGHIEETSNEWIWCLLFGALYFVYKGIWIHAIISFALAWFTFGISWLIYPFFAKDIVLNNYSKNGWVEIKEE